MPRSIHGTKLDAKQHRMWRHVFDSLKSQGKDDAAAGGAATNAVKRDLGEKTASDPSHVQCLMEDVRYGAMLRDMPSIKVAAEAEETVALSGKLYLTKHNWLMLDIPNDIVNGLFSAINEHGVEVPPAHGNGGVYKAHVSVMRPNEVAKLGGGDKITERGKTVSYQLGPVKTTNPAGWAEMERVWFVEIESDELKAIRKKYGLTALPNNGKFQFHITFAVRKAKGGLQKPSNKVAAVPGGEYYSAMYDSAVGNAKGEKQMAQSPDRPHMDPSEKQQQSSLVGKLTGIHPRKRIAQLGTVPNSPKDQQVPPAVKAPAMRGADTAYTTNALG